MPPLALRLSHEGDDRERDRGERDRDDHDEPSEGRDDPEKERHPKVPVEAWISTPVADSAVFLARRKGPW
jgi:hypothetical protein